MLKNKSYTESKCNIHNNNPEVFSSPDKFWWKFLLSSFDGLATWKMWTVSDIFDIFLKHQHQLVYYILSDIVKAYCYFWSKPRRKQISQWTDTEFSHFSRMIQNPKIFFSKSYKVGVYKENHYNEPDLYWIDKEIVDYFRILWFDVSVDFNQPLSAGVTNPIYLKISSK